MIEVTIPGLSKLLDDFEKGPIIYAEKMAEALRLGTYYTQRIEKQLAPVDRGYLRSLIVTRIDGDEGVVSSRASYTKFVHDGTGIYGPNHQRIYPKKAKVLAWKRNGKWNFRKSVAGQKANPFIEKTRDYVEPMVIQFYTKAIENVIVSMS